MRKFVLFAIIVLLILFPILLWIGTLSHNLGAGLPLGIYIGVYLHDASRFLAVVGFVIIFIQYVLSSKIKLIEKGVGLDKLFRVHRIFGVIGLIFILIHPSLLFISDILQGMKPNLFIPLKIVGMFALILLFIPVIAAILYGRIKMKYEVWKNIHRAIYIMFPIAFFHSIRFGSDLIRSLPLKIFWWIIMALFIAILIYKVVMRIRIRRNPFKVSKLLQETHDIWSLFFEGKHKNYKPGQFLTVSLVREGKVSESHPFTISSSPTSDKLSISVKSVGDFTSTIKDTKISDSAYIDEPYGMLSFLNYDARNLVFIAGGIGITPFMSMLRYIYDKKLERNIILIWGNKTSGDIVFKQELEKIESEMPSLKIIHIMSKQDDWQGEKGFVDAEKIRKYVSDLVSSQFFVCGPPVMMNIVIKALKGLGIPKRRIHYERFALR